ncbi:ornithine cyclodeaminase family protein [Rheinheimera sp.]|uniref:ornithine cyclodeaminase family protein n=1 Tax=Rheinheimera sp. TaxID=1869214 RepID=UPI003D2BFAFD
MQFISAQQVDQVLEFPMLINALQRGFANEFSMPARQVFPLSPAGNEAFALLPAWTADLIGVKAFCYFPGNSTVNLPTLHSNILLYRREDGTPLAMVEGTRVTCWRTAAVSALAARYLARHDAATLLLLGTGALALPLILAHLSERPLRRLLLWGRSPAKAAQLRQQVQQRYPALEIEICTDIKAGCREADIIVAATGSATPLLFGADIRPGCHVDVLGNHSPAQRECDSVLLQRASVYVDDRRNVLNEAGELLIPINEGVFAASAIRAELAELCRANRFARQSDQEITLFKSVGTALADLLCAGLVLQQPYFS